MISPCVSLGGTPRRAPSEVLSAFSVTTCCSRLYFSLVLLFSRRGNGPVLLIICSRVSLGRRRGLATWSSSHLQWQMSVRLFSFQPSRASEICFTLTIIAVRRPLIIKYSSTYHSLLVVGVCGVWGLGVMGFSFLLASCHLLAWRE